MPALDFYCGFTGTQFRGNLLVEQPGNHQTHDFTLAYAKPGIALLQFSQLLLLFAEYAVTAERALNHIEQVLVPEWLREELDGTGLHGGYGHRNICVAGDENDGNLDPCLLQFVLKIQAADAGKSYVQHQATGTASPLP